MTAAFNFPEVERGTGSTSLKNYCVETAVQQFCEAEETKYDDVEESVEAQAYGIEGGDFCGYRGYFDVFSSATTACRNVGCVFLLSGHCKNTHPTFCVSKL